MTTFWGEVYSFAPLIMSVVFLCFALFVIFTHEDDEDERHHSRHTHK